LSLGERMKMELILAILHEPELLFLDEPTIGLDFNAANQIRQFLKGANEKLGITTILTSHYTKDIEELCRRVIVINQGVVVYDGALDGLDPRLKGERVMTLTASTDENLGKVKAWVANQSGLNFLDAVPDNKYEVRFSVSTELATKVSKHLWQIFTPEQIQDFTIEERSLEEVFSDIYARTSSQ
ncbi:MAG: hypothetical protein NTV34_11495, partial [Proteobacteria bacterium]|nr:hypothetical protein [Pseudomonadota bacterium]